MPTEAKDQIWYYIRDRKKVGPVHWTRLHELAAGGQLRPADMVLPGGATHWMQALAVEGLFPAPNAPASQGPAPLPLAAMIPLPTATFGPAVAAPLSGAAMLPSIPGYTIVGELGRGGMGVVYKAEQSKLKRLVALKMILGGAVAGAQQLERFRAEAEAVARLQHPNIVQVYEVGEHGGLPFFSLEYCAGGSLAQRLDGTPLPAREAAALIETLARAIQAAHERHIVHRDLKPANVLLTGDGVPKITDFGLAKKMDAAEALTQSARSWARPVTWRPNRRWARPATQGRPPTSTPWALSFMSC